MVLRTETALASVSPNNRTFSVLGIRVNAVQISDTIRRIEDWIADRGSSRYIAVTGMHGVIESRRDPEALTALRGADLVVPDGMSLVWLGRLHGIELKRRVYGPELMESFFSETEGRYKHFFYGAGSGVPEKLAEHYRQSFGANVVGTFSPPFRPMTAEEEWDLAERIRETRPDVLWVGLSTPKQEKWMFAHRALTVPVMVGVGAAFDFNSGNLKQAPSWMRENGLEWLFRLLTNPRRLWRRYLVLGPQFVCHVCAELCRLRKYD